MVWTTSATACDAERRGYWLVGDRDGVLASGCRLVRVLVGMRIYALHSRLSGSSPRDRTLRCYNSAVAHREQPAIALLAAPLPCSLGASHHEPDGIRSPRTTIRRPELSHRVFPTPVPGKDLLSTLAGRDGHRAVPTARWVENIAEGREIGGFQCHPHLRATAPWIPDPLALANLQSVNPSTPIVTNHGVHLLPSLRLEPAACGSPSAGSVTRSFSSGALASWGSEGNARRSVDENTG